MRLPLSHDTLHETYNRSSRSQMALQSARMHLGTRQISCSSKQFRQKNKERRKALQGRLKAFTWRRAVSGPWCSTDWANRAAHIESQAKFGACNGFNLAYANSENYAKNNLRWLDTVFQGQYLPSLSINYVVINNDLDKLPPQLYEICCDQGCNDIGVVVAPKWRRYLLYLRQFLCTGNCSAKIVYRSFFLQHPPWWSWSLGEICKSVIIFWDEVFIRNTVKNWSTWYSAVICRKRRAFVPCNFTS